MSEFTLACPVAAAPTFPNRREVPEQWPDLLKQATAIIGEQSPDGAELPPTIDQVTAMHEVVVGLSNEELEASRYYAIGGTLCYFARRVADPQAYADVVDRGARSLCQEALIWDEAVTGLAIGRIGQYSAYNHPFRDISRAAVADLPAPNHLLAETLVTAEVMRRYDTTLQAQQDRIAKQANGSNNLAESITLNATAGAGFVVRHAIAVRGEGADRDNYDKTIGELIEPGELAVLGDRLRKVAVGCAQLRADEMQRLTLRTGFPIEAVLQADEHHVLTFDREYLRTVPQPPQEVNGKPKGIHERRLECPALQVGMIPMMVRLMADITMRADQLIAADYAHLHAPQPAAEPAVRQVPDSEYFTDDRYWQT